jgi:hypothetical protein
LAGEVATAILVDGREPCKLTVLAEAMSTLKALNIKK